MMYIVIYDRSKGLTVITVTMIFNIEIKLGEWHWHKRLFVPVDHGNNMSVQQITELAIQKL